MTSTTKFLIDGIDRLGKSSLANSIMNELGYHLMIHYDKPKVLSYYTSQEIEGNDARKKYQIECNSSMFNLLKTNLSVIVDRTHLGEMVYAPFYRGYDGDYVFGMEQNLINSKPYTYKDDIKLILLTTSNLDMLTDDGNSFDFSKKGEEQERFIQAFNMSQLTKIKIDVHNGSGGYRSYKDILEEVLTNK